MAPKRRKVDDEGRVFNKLWTNEFFFVQSKNMALCLICKESIAVMKTYNIKRHYDTKHFKTYSSLDGTCRLKKVEALLKSWKSQANLGAYYKQFEPDISKRPEIRASNHVAKIISEEERPFTDGEFVKKCILKIVKEICPEKLSCFDSVNLSEENISRIIEDFETGPNQ